MTGTGMAAQPPTTTCPPPAQAAVDPPTGHVVQTMPDGTRVEFDGAGTPVRQWTPDGATLSLDGSGKVTAESLPDGTRYTSFDEQGRPTAGVTAAGLDFTVAYGADGSSVDTFADGSQKTFDPGGKPVVQVTADGTRFTEFDGSGRPHTGVLPDGSRFTMSYLANGDVVDQFADGSSVEFDGGGRLVRQVTADGTVFTAFDGQGRPTAGVTTAGAPFTIAYDDSGDIFQRAADGSVTEFSPDGKPIKTWTADGVEIDWAVDLAALGDAVGHVSANRDEMASSIRRLGVVFGQVLNLWQSPAGKSFDVLQTDFNTITTRFTNLLDEAIDRMRQTHANYVNAEQTNTQNLS